MNPIVEVFDKAIELLTPRGAWGQGDYAVDKHGDATDVTSNRVAKRCVIGSIRAASCMLYPGGFHKREDYERKAVDTFQVVVGKPAVEFNDAPGRKKREIIAALKKAKKRAAATA